ncbi:MAG: cytochrome [Deltaproteobacteria bacterium]|nr:cytochrome [Deltaproteobacteria bacterium]
MKKPWMILFFFLLIPALSFSATPIAKEKKTAKKPTKIAGPKVDESICLGCHPEIQALWESGKHNRAANCAVCHLETAGHLDDIFKKPVTRLDLEACGSCHKDQYRTLMEVNVKSRAKVEKATTTSRSPTFGRTSTRKESSGTWWWTRARSCRKRRRPPIRCAFPAGCIHCHDPHATKPRVIQSPLIQAAVDRGEGTYPYDPKKSGEVTIRKIMFPRDGQDFRAIGILNKPDSNVLCAQCHVEYNCNPGIDTKTGGPVGMEDRRTNYYPWVNVFDLQKRYESIAFKDFRHSLTGAALTKIQHPDVESYWGSKHERAGVECKHCHMPKMKQKEKEFTFHGQRSARYLLKDTCVRCHPQWSPEQAEYQVDAVQNYIRGKMRKAEFWLGELISAFGRAKDAGAGEEALDEARKEHDRAHILWEWWTAENSDGFHNPEMARQSLAESINASQKGIEILNKAVAQKAAPK